jgi:hypothetical protein
MGIVDRMLDIDTMPSCPAIIHTAVLAGLLRAETPQLRLSENKWPDSGTRPWLSGMPLMSGSHSPNSVHWTNSIALCAVMKDENITDIVEWLLYYQCVPCWCRLCVFLLAWRGCLW